ncbi:ATP-binding cassette domain-containing protein, partial [Sedimenticola sp.]
GDRWNAFPDQLSGGEQQRVAIARALIHNPSIVLADEPTGNLDAETGDKILGILLGLSKQLKRTLIIVTHSLEVAKRADRILTLNDGVLSEQGEIHW